MPIYNFKCPKCDKVFESISGWEDPKAECPDCKVECQRAQDTSDYRPALVPTFKDWYNKTRGHVKGATPPTEQFANELQGTKRRKKIM
jgi:putative FmdB family regulatory protein